METTTNEFKKPMIDIVAIRSMMESATINHGDAERIAMAIDASLRSQDITGNATKGDIEALRQATKSDIQNLEHKIENSRLKTIIWLGGICFTIALSTVGVLLGVLGKWLGKW